MCVCVCVCVCVETHRLPSLGFTAWRLELLEQTSVVSRLLGFPSINRTIYDALKKCPTMEYLTEMSALYCALDLSVVPSFVMVDNASVLLYAWDVKQSQQELRRLSEPWTILAQGYSFSLRHQRLLGLSCWLSVKHGELGVVKYSTCLSRCFVQRRQLGHDQDRL
jgi:hypothetical protein